MEITKIELLTEQQYLAYKHLISSACWCWWLSTPVSDNDWWLHIVERDGKIYHANCCQSNVSIRPCCTVSVDSDNPIYWKRRNSLIGTKIKMGQYEWTILDVISGSLLMLCDSLMGEHGFDLYTNIWEKSELKRWLETEGIKLLN